MSESVKPRFAVDLGEIERQIAQAQPAPSQPISASRNDPLAELARIVGQDDPFQSLLASEPPARRGQAGSNLDDLFAAEPAPAARGAAQPQSQVQPQARQSDFDLTAFDLDSYPQAPARAAEPAYAYQAPAAAPSRGHDTYDAGAHSLHYYDEAPQGAAGYEQAKPMGYEPVAKPRSRKGLIAVGAILGAVVIGGGGAYLMSGKSGVASGGQPPLIKATNEPVKVQPQNPGGVEIPNQNKQIYERANTNTETKVVSREEQPVDVKQVARMNSGNTDATASTSLNLGEPRKVRTVSIKPDGSAAKPEAPASAGANTNASANANARPVAMPAPMTLPPAAQPTPPAPTQAQAAQPKPTANTPVAAPAIPAAKPAATAAATPAPAAPAAPTPAPQKVASAQPMAPAPAATVSEGGYSVQLAVRGSEGEAQTAFQQLQKKYDDLDGVPSMIRKAEVNGNTVYRVRVGPLSREEASSLCSKLQGQGGQCFVAKN
ncbi:SPOR domain-containing protein [Microvirga terricola]|uniref:SPOR domain-containing protein n=1 Tax=Microvirga terricola TaxID=2719797 RepID=A0ABX0VBK9_9HYPH|nr:SPOR domain-containing protein [Microvirga terricola]NIX77237.1 SPOR domain-containing protein [Microvirga terricola]